MPNDFKVTRNDYDQLSNHLTQAHNTHVQENAVKLHSKQGALKSIEHDIKERSLKIINLSSTSPIYKTNEQYIAEQEERRESLASEITKLQEETASSHQDSLSFEEFLNVANNASSSLKAADVLTKDRIARLIYLNVVVNDQNVIRYQIREPFKTYFRLHKIYAGRGERT